MLVCASREAQPLSTRACARSIHLLPTSLFRLSWPFLLSFFSRRHRQKCAQAEKPVLPESTSPRFWDPAFRDELTFLSDDHPEKGTLLRFSSRTSTVSLFRDDSCLLQEVRRLAAEFQQKYQHLHVLVNNAGAIYSSRLRTRGLLCAVTGMLRAGLGAAGRAGTCLFFGLEKNILLQRSAPTRAMLTR